MRLESNRSYITIFFFFCTSKPASDGFCTTMIIEALLATALAPVPLTAGGYTFRMVPVRGGEFDMGDEVGDLWAACRPVHRVQLDDFWMGQFPVTQALWRAVAQSDEVTLSHPINSVNPNTNKSFATCKNNISFCIHIVSKSESSKIF